MSYGLPYQGSKNRVAKRLVDALPPAPVLYDVFCGGCAITHAAMLSGKYKSVVANDVNGMIPAAFQTAITGGFKNEDRWISREDFRRLYLTDPYVAMCFSFANNLNDYCYVAELEPYKRALHYAIFWRDFAPWAALCPETADALAAGLAPIEDRKQRRVQAGYFIVESLKAQLAAEMLTPDILDKPIYRQIKPKDTPHSLGAGYCLKLQSLVSLERLQSLESLQSLPDTLTVYSMDYHELCFDEPGIIYCDPPYKDTAGYGELFCHDEFYGWCEAQKLPVYISEYQMPEDRFACIAEWNKVTTMAAKMTTHVTERLWRPRTQL